MIAQHEKSSAFRATSGWIPLLMSGAATALVVGYLATGPHEPAMVLDNGALRQDESPAARLWQLLMVLQLPAIAFFAAHRGDDDFAGARDRSRRRPGLPARQLGRLQAVAPRGNSHATCDDQDQRAPEDGRERRRAAKCQTYGNSQRERDRRVPHDPMPRGEQPRLVDPAATALAEPDVGSGRRYGRRGRTCGAAPKQRRATAPWPDPACPPRRRSSRKAARRRRRRTAPRTPRPRPRKARPPPR